MSDRAFDGVVCFGGEDWWYHNRGHFDMQLMRELARDLPVLYVNSIGMRVPKPGEGAMFLVRVRRKLRSLRRGVVAVRERFSVMSPAAVPGGRGGPAADAFLAWQVRRAARRLGIRRPLAWVACPPASGAALRLGAAGLVYQRTDRMEHFAGVDHDAIVAHDRRLKESADLVLFCSASVHAEEAESCRASLYVDHGVDFDAFRRAGDAGDDPADVAELPRPRVGFVGGIDAHTFWPELFAEVVRRVPEATFFLVGACSLPEGWIDEPNCRLLGQRDYADVPGYMAAADVLVMPWNRSPWIKACNPVKLKEYLAVGRPVVSTSFDELRNYEGFVRVADDAESFARQIRAALAEGADVARSRERVQRESWTARRDAVLARLRGAGIAPGAPGSAWPAAGRPACEGGGT